MGNPDTGLLCAQITANLDQAADVAGEDRVCSGGEKVLRFAQA